MSELLKQIRFSKLSGIIIFTKAMEDQQSHQTKTVVVSEVEYPHLFNREMWKPVNQRIPPTNDKSASTLNFAAFAGNRIVIDWRRVQRC